MNQVNFLASFQFTLFILALIGIAFAVLILATRQTGTTRGKKKE